MRARVLLALVIAVAPACDDSQAFRRPHPSLERMQTQERVDPFDGRGMRAPPPDTVPRDDPSTDPADVDLALLEDGRACFDRICATCHGVLGDGRSVVASKMLERPPPSLHDPRIVALSPRRTFEVITDGYGLMPSFAHELTPRDRWAVVAYLDALRLSRRAVVSELPPDLRDELARGAGRAP